VQLGHSDRLTIGELEWLRAALDAARLRRSI
jgi:hypothetical protein